MVMSAWKADAVAAVPNPQILTALHLPNR